MKNIISTFTAIFIITALTAGCANQSNSNPSETKVTAKSDSVTIQADSTQQIENAKQWIVTTVENFFRDYDKNHGDFSGICTKQYAEFKVDATNVDLDLDASLSLSEFKEKWGRRYSEYAGIGSGFIVGGNDFGVIKVPVCNFENKTEMGGLLFDTRVDDTTMNARYYRKIIVVPDGDSFLIDDVLEIKDEVMQQN